MGTSTPLLSPAPWFSARRLKAWALPDELPPPLRLVTLDEEEEEIDAKEPHVNGNHEKMLQELKQLRREKVLRDAKPAIADESMKTSRDGLNISMPTLVLVGSLIGIIGFLWNYIGQPLTALRDDVHDLKANYVSKENLNTALSNLATKPDFNNLSSSVNKLTTDMATVQNQNNVSITERASLKEAQMKQDAINSAIQQRLAGLEAKQR